MNINRIKKNIKKVEEIVESIDVQDVINRMEKDKENSIEEDIKIIEDFINWLTIDFEYDSGNEIKAIEHILSAYQEVLKENEELKEERQIVGIAVRNKRDGKIGIVLHQWESGSVAVLESINPRVINTHDSWNTLEIVTDEVKQTQTKCETIPVQKVKDKIEEYKNMLKTCNKAEDIDRIKAINERVLELQELLGSEK